MSGLEQRREGDAWVEAADGKKYWGKFGAAGLVAHDPHRGVVLQHRVEWSHFGGTWGIPGGAIDRGESAVAGAIREASEEAGIPQELLTPRYTYRVDKGGWSYTTVIADASAPFEPQITDPESLDLAWVPVEEVETYPLHPGFEKAWPELKPVIGRPTTVVVDTANVVGSVPNGWWKDPLGAAQTLRDKIATLEEVSPLFAGFHGKKYIRLEGVYPDWHLVTEKTMRPLTPCDGVDVTPAESHGDDTIMEVAQAAMNLGHHVVVVTSDAELQNRALHAGAVVRGATHLTRIVKHVKL